MDLRDYVGALRKGWWMLLVTMLLGGAVGAGFALATPAKYAGSVTFFVRTTGSEGTALQGDQFGQQRVNSYVQLLTTDRLARRIIRDTGLDLTPAQVMGMISGTSDIDTVLLKATVIDASYERSKMITDSLSKQFVLLVDEIELPTTAKNGASASLEVVSGPTSNPVPISPRPKLDIGLGLAAGLGLGAIFAILRKVLDNTIRGADGLRALGPPVLGSVPFDRRAKRSPLIVESQSQSLRAEALRQLRTNLRFVDVTSPAKVIVVTSSVPGEGKSTTATNLAVAFAENEDRVLLIEADLRRPRVAEYLGIEGGVGLTDVLIGEVSIDDVLQPWGDRGLTVLAAGSSAPNPSELLGSSAMRDLLGNLRQRFDVILVDTPPLLPVTDGAVIATEADGALLVVRFGKTRRTQIFEATENLKGVDARLLGFVLNQVPVTGPDKHIAYGKYGDYATVVRPSEGKVFTSGTDDNSGDGQLDAEHVTSESLGNRASTEDDPQSSVAQRDPKGPRAERRSRPRPGSLDASSPQR